MNRSTPAGVERDLKSSFEQFKTRATAIKDAHRATRQEIQADEMASDFAKSKRIEELDAETRTKLDAIREEQETYVRNKRYNLERELLGDQPTDANSVLLRRDAADRARRVADESEAMAVMADAVRGGDDSRARQSGWVDALDAYREAHPRSADSAQALAVVEALSTDPAYNLATGITYSAP